MFKKFPSIENTYRKSFIQKIFDEGFDKMVWVVTEKVHGANTSFWYNNKTGEFIKASRENIIPDDEKFLGIHNVYTEEFKEKIKFVARQCEALGYQFTSIGLYGELCGGSHPEIKEKTSVKIQKGIIYSPKNEFIVFRIILDHQVLPKHLTCDVCERAGIAAMKPLFVGSFEEALKYPNEFNSKILKQLGYDTIENNVCEGVVIEPLHAMRFRNGDAVVLKNKNSKWAEKARVKKHDPSVQEEDSEEVARLKSEAGTYVTLNRLLNVLSKIGEVTQKDFGKVIGSFSKDVVDDFEKDFSSDISFIEKNEYKKVTSFINNEATKLLRQNFLDIIDGTI